MRDHSPTKLCSRTRGERGATTVDYAVTIVCLVLATLSAVILLADPTGGPDDSALPGVYKSVSGKVGTFGTVSE